MQDRPPVFGKGGRPGGQLRFFGETLGLAGCLSKRGGGQSGGGGQEGFLTQRL